MTNIRGTPRASILSLTLLTAIVLGAVDGRSEDRTSEVRGAPDTAGVETAAKNGARWPMFRGGPRLHGVRDLRISDKPRLLWTFDTSSEIESSAAIENGVAYVGTNDGHLLALAIAAGSKKGKLLWRYEAEAGIRSSPGIRAGRIFFGDDFGFIYGVDAANGKEVWKHETEGGAEIISSPNFVGDVMLIGSYDGNLYAMDMKAGTKRWSFLTGAPLHCTPAVTSGKTFVAGCDEILRVIDLANGKEISQMELGVNTAASPAVSGDMLYVGTFGSQVVAIDWKKGETKWVYEHATRHFPYYSSAALTDEAVIVGGRDKMIHCIDRKTGKEQWTFATRARVESSPLVAGNRVIVGSNDRKLYMLDLDSGKEVWQFGSDGGFPASPALADGKLVIGSDSGLVYCFDVSSSDGVPPAANPERRSPQVSGATDTDPDS